MVVPDRVMLLVPVFRLLCCFRIFIVLVSSPFSLYWFLLRIFDSEASLIKTNETFVVYSVSMVDFF